MVIHVWQTKQNKVNENLDEHQMKQTIKWSLQIENDCWNTPVATLYLRQAPLCGHNFDERQKHLPDFCSTFS